MSILVILRHGQSTWNLENRYTGWTDVDLSVRGVEEACLAGDFLKTAGIRFDWALTSVLKRAIRTLWIVQERTDCFWIPSENTWRLNERHYGALQGLNKKESEMFFGPEQVFLWRRSFSARPPALMHSDTRHPRFDRRYACVPEAELPVTESLADTLARVLPCWEAQVIPRLRKGLNVLIVAHGNSLRALVTYLNQIPEDQVPGLVIPTGIPIVYEFDDALRIERQFNLQSRENALSVRSVDKDSRRACTCDFKKGR